MSRGRFVLVVADRDTGEFSVEGPMKDDQSWNKAVVDAKDGTERSLLRNSGSDARHGRCQMAVNGRRDEGRFGLHRLAERP